MKTFLTLGDLKRLTNEPTHRVQYAIDRYGPQPATRVAGRRLWTEDQLPEVRESLGRTAEQRTAGAGK